MVAIEEDEQGIWVFQCAQLAGVSDGPVAFGREGPEILIVED
jgi:hypothetical protein